MGYSVRALFGWVASYRRAAAQVARLPFAVRLRPPGRPIRLLHSPRGSATQGAEEQSLVRQGEGLVEVLTKAKSVWLCSRHLTH